MRLRPPHASVLLLIAVLLQTAGCAGFPDVDAAASTAARNAEYPDLAPLEDLLAQGAGGRLSGTGGDAVAAGSAEADAVEARAARLRARAAALRRTAG